MRASDAEERQARGAQADTAIDLLEKMFVAIGAASRFCLAIRPEKEVVIAGIKSCAVFPQLWRDNLAGILVPLGIGEGAGVKPKYHMLEAHMAAFYKTHGALGEYSEGGMESLHKDVGGYHRLWNAVVDVEHLWQLTDHRRPLVGEKRARELGKERKARLKNRRGS